MRGAFERLASMLAAACIALALMLTAATAQDIKQLKLTEAQVLGFIASQKDLVAIAEKLQAAGEKIDPALQGELDSIAKKHGFSSFENLDDVAANISLVMAGLDPEKGTFTDPVDALKKELEEIKADATIPEKDKKQMIEELTEALKSTPPIQFMENVEVVKKHREAIEKSLQ